MERVTGIRRACESDKAMIEKWIAEEPSHCHTADLYFEPLTESYVFEDEDGARLVCRISRAMRVDIDFSNEDRLKTARALPLGFAWLREQAVNAGFRELIFDSKSEPLIKFCEKRLGFRKSPQELVAVLGQVPTVASSSDSNGQGH